MSLKKNRYGEYVLHLGSVIYVHRMVGDNEEERGKRARLASILDAIPQDRRNENDFMKHVRTVGLENEFQRDFYSSAEKRKCLSLVGLASSALSFYALGKEDFPKELASITGLMGTVAGFMGVYVFSLAELYKRRVAKYFESGGPFKA